MESNGRMKSYYQSYSCDGFNAKITIEWSFPLEKESYIETNLCKAERIADIILSDNGQKMREMVQTMRGKL